MVAEAHPERLRVSRLAISRAGLVVASTWTLFAGAVLLGGVLRVRLLAVGSLWLDELWTLDAITGSYPRFLSKLVVDQAPPLWTSLALRWQHLTGSYNPVVLRSLSALLSGIAVLAPILGALRMPRLRPALLLVGALMALSVLVVQYAVEFRNYSFLIATSSCAMVIWAGLISQELPATRPWVVAFLLVGSTGGLAHYYGNIAQAALLASLAGYWAVTRHPAVRFLAGWGLASFTPALGWYVTARPWSPGQAVAAEPSLEELARWLQASFDPVTSLLATWWPSSAATAGAAVVVGCLAFLLGQGVRVTFRGVATSEWPVGLVVGCCAFAALVVGIALSWTLSLLLPPTMNVRNLSALVPVLFAAVACALTAGVHELTRWATAGLSMLVWLGAAGLLVASHGVAALAPSWQLSAGYRPAVALVLASQQQADPPQLIGVMQAWGWHGDWDAAVAAYSGAGSAAESPLRRIVWVSGPDDPSLLALDAGELLVFGYADDQRTTALLALLSDQRGACQEARWGEPGYGNVTTATCGPAG